MKQSAPLIGFIALAMMLFISTAIAEDSPCPYKEVNLGEIPKLSAETLPAPKLVDALEQNLLCDIVGVKFTCVINENWVDYKKLVYDRERKLLILLGRSRMTALDDQFSWRIWYNVSPSDFAKRMPYGRDDIQTEGSPFANARAVLFIKYTGPHEAIAWPSE